MLDIEAERNVFVGPNIEAIMGYSLTEAMTPGFHRRIVKPEVWRKSIELLQSHDFEANFFAIKEIPMLCAHGKERWFLTLEIAYKRAANGRVTHTIGNCFVLPSGGRLMLSGSGLVSNCIWPMTK